MADDLYDQDFYLWTRAQAEALRARAGGSNVLDYERLAEEVEDLGSAQRNKAESLIRQIIAHLYKLSVSQRVDPINHWRVEIVEFRVQAEAVLTGAIRRGAEERLEALHRQAFRLAEANMAVYEPDVALDANLRWSLPQILGEQDDPSPAPRPR